MTLSNHIHGKNATTNMYLMSLLSKISVLYKLSVLSALSEAWAKATTHVGTDPRPWTCYNPILRTQPFQQEQPVSTFSKNSPSLVLPFDCPIFLPLLPNPCEFPPKKSCFIIPAAPTTTTTPLFLAKTFERSLRCNLLWIQVLSGFLLQRWQPLWQGVVGTKVWKAWQGKARRAKVATRRAGPMSASPQASPPATAPCTLSTKTSERKEQ